MSKVNIAKIAKNVGICSENLVSISESLISISECCLADYFKLHFSDCFLPKSV